MNDLERMRALLAMLEEIKALQDRNVGFLLVPGHAQRADQAEDERHTEPLTTTGKSERGEVSA